MGTIVSLAACGLTAVTIGFALTAPVLIVVDRSARLDQGGRFRVAASSLYLGMLGVAILDRLRYSPARNVAANQEIPFWSLMLIVFNWCFLIVYAFSVVITTTHAYKKRKVDSVAIASAFVPAAAYYFATEAVPSIQELQGILGGLNEILQVISQLATLSDSSSETVRGAIPEDVPQQGNVATVSEAEGAAFSLSIVYTVVESVTSNMMVAVAAAAVAFLTMVPLADAFQRERRSYYNNMGYCVILAMMLYSHVGTSMITLTFLADVLIWLQVWSIILWAYRICEVTLLLILPLAWFVHWCIADKEGSAAGHGRSGKDCAITLLPTLVYIVFLSLGW